MGKLIFSKEDIPQANDLSRVGKTVLAVGSGMFTFQKIAKHVKFTDRQGRYYRRAAEILELIDTPTINRSVLTNKGTEFLKALENGAEILTLLSPHVERLPLVRELFEILGERQEFSQEELLETLIKISAFESGSATVQRRLSTVIGWLKQCQLLVEDDESSKLRLERKLQVLPDKLKAYSQFVESLSPYLYVAKDFSGEDWKTRLELFDIQSSSGMKALVDDPINARLARAVLGISAKELIDLSLLKRETAKVLQVEVTHARVLVERDRSMKYQASLIAKDGKLLEAAIASWFERFNFAPSRNHLFAGNSKNVDFYVQELNLAIESKYSKGSGTKHSGAIQDLESIAKAKRTDSSLLLGVVLAGKGFDGGFMKELERLYKSKTIDFVLSPDSFVRLNPGEIRRMSRFAAPTANEMEFASKSNLSWAIPMRADESALEDAVFWFSKYSKISYLSLASRLETWVSQTPFAIYCLRLILGWSESQMESFIRTAIPNSISLMRTGEVEFTNVSALVNSLLSKIDQEEISSVERFIDREVSVNDLIEARLQNLEGAARRKHDTSRQFIEIVKSIAGSSVVQRAVKYESVGDQQIVPSLSVQIPRVGTCHVLAKFYSSSGSVMSDLVKTIEGVVVSKAENWIFILDGPGWRSRDADLRRIFSLTENTKVQVMNLKQWADQFAVKVPQKRIP